MKISERKLLLWLAIPVILTLVASSFVWQWINQPLYLPGKLKTAGLNLDPHSMDSHGSYFQVEPGIRVYHESLGDVGKPTILVVHGGPGFPMRAATSGLSALGQSHQIHLYDQRGCGNSTKPFDRFTGGNYYANMKTLEGKLGIGAQLADIERIRRILRREKLILLGHSFGAFLAALYAAEFPERVEALVLVAPSDTLVLPNRSNNGFFDQIRSGLREAQRPNFDAFLSDYLNFGNSFSESEHSLAEKHRILGDYFLKASGLPSARAADEIQNGGWAAQAMYFSMGRRHDYRSALSTVSAPVLIVHGEGDFLSNRAIEEYDSAFSNASVRVIEKSMTRAAGHFVFSDQPETFAAVVKEFLDAELPARSGLPSCR